MRSFHPVLCPLMAALALGCSQDGRAPEGGGTPFEPQLAALAGASWSAPVKLGPPISVPLVTDANAMLSPDGLSLYYDSDRTDLPGAQGARDIWVARRDCTDADDPACAWQTPVNLGPRINTPYVDGLPTLSIDGHLLFFLSHMSRPDCPAEPDELDPTRPCDADIFVSWRDNPHDDLGWGDAVPLPAPVNTTDEDNISAFVPVGEAGRGNLYFDRSPAGTSESDIHYVPIRVTARGLPFGPFVAVLGPVMALQEINLATVGEGGVFPSVDGRELFFTAPAVSRPGGTGTIGLDIWTSTRRSPSEPWGQVTNVEVNSANADLTPRLSFDGRTLVFTSNRGMAAGPCRALGLSGFCGMDIYMATRGSQP